MVLFLPQLEFLLASAFLSSRLPEQLLLLRLVSAHWASHAPLLPLLRDLAEAGLCREGVLRLMREAFGPGGQRMASEVEGNGAGIFPLRGT